jgi:hypothetical protein
VSEYRPELQEQRAPCPDKGCGARFGHSLICRLASVEERAAQRDTAVQGWHKSISEAERLRQQVVFWQGKFAMVKHENNKLRRKVEALTENCELLLEVDALRQAMKEPLVPLVVKGEE